MDNKAPARVHTDDSGFLSQYWDCMRRTGFVEPEKYLLLAVLKDAFLDYTRNCSAHDTRFRKAHSWFFFEHSSRLFSFEIICEVLNLDPAFIRRHLTALRQEKIAPKLELAHSAPGPRRKPPLARPNEGGKKPMIVRSNLHANL